MALYAERVVCVSRNWCLKGAGGVLFGHFQSRVKREADLDKFDALIQSRKSPYRFLKKLDLVWFMCLRTLFK